MALEYNICGFENGKTGELLFGGTPSFGGLSIQGAASRTGTYRLQIVTTNGTSNLVTFPAGNITGTSGTVSSGNHKRVRVRAYIRIDAQTAPFGNSQIRIFGLGGEFDTNGVNVWMDQNRKFTVKFGSGLPTITGSGYGLSAATISSIGCIGGTNVAQILTSAPHGFQSTDLVTIAGVADGNYNVANAPITVTSASVFTYIIGSNRPNSSGGTATYISGPTTSFIGPINLAAWYRFILDVDYNVSSNTAYAVSLQITEDSSTPTFDQTMSISGNMGNTDDMRKVSFLSERIRGAFDFSGTFSYDDVTYYAASDADAVNQLVLPTATKILPVPITGVGTGVLASAGPDQFIYISHTPLAGSASTYSLNTYGLSGAYTNASEIPVDVSGGGLGAYLESSLGTGTYIMFTHDTAANLGITSVAVAKVYANGAINGAGSGAVDVVIGYNEVSPESKSLVWGGAYGDNGGSVNPATVVSVLGWTAALFNSLAFGIRKQNGTQTTRLGNILAEVLYL